MPSLLERLNADLRDAMRSGDSLRRDEIRGVIAMLRAEQQSKLKRTLEGHGLILEDSHDVALSPEQQSMISELRAELYKLAPENRSCFLLHLDGYSYHEIGKLTGYTKARVRTSIQTAKRHIKRRA